MSSPLLLFDGLVLECERLCDLSLLEDVVFDSSLVEHIIMGLRWKRMATSINSSLNTLTINCFLISKVIGERGCNDESLNGLFLDYVFALSIKGKKIPSSIVTKNIIIESLSHNDHRLIALLLISPSSSKSLLYQQSLSFLLSQKTIPDYIIPIAKLVGEHIRQEDVEFTLNSFSKLHSKNSLLCLRMIGLFMKGFLKAKLSSFYEEIFDIYYFPIITGAQTSQWTVIRTISFPGKPQADPIEKIIISLNDSRFMSRHSSTFLSHLLTKFANYISTPLKGEQSAIYGKRSISSFFEGGSLHQWQGHQSSNEEEEISFLLTRMIGKYSTKSSISTKLALILRGDLELVDAELIPPFEDGNLKDLKDIGKRFPSLPLPQLLLKFLKNDSSECLKSFLPSLIAALSFEEKNRIISFLKDSVLSKSLLSLLINDNILKAIVINQCNRRPSTTFSLIIAFIYEKESIFSRLSFKTPSDEEWVGIPSLIEECSNNSCTLLITRILTHIPLRVILPHLREGPLLQLFLDSPLAIGNESPILLNIINESWKKGDKDLLIRELKVYFGDGSRDKMALFRNLIYTENNLFSYSFSFPLLCALEHCTKSLFDILGTEELKECLLKATMTPDLWRKIEEVLINSSHSLLDVFAALKPDVVLIPTPFEESIMLLDPLNEFNLNKKVRIVHLLELLEPKIEHPGTLTLSNSFKLSILFSKQGESSLIRNYDGLFEYSINLILKEKFIHPNTLKVLSLSFQYHPSPITFIKTELKEVWEELLKSRRPTIISVRNPNLDLTEGKRLLLLEFLLSLDHLSSIDIDDLFIWIVNNPLKDLPSLKDCSLKIALSLLGEISLSFHEISSLIERVLMNESPLQGIILLASLFSIVGDNVSPDQLDDLIGKIINSLQNDENVLQSACTALRGLVSLLPSDQTYYKWVKFLFARINTSKTNILVGEARALATLISVKRLWATDINVEISNCIPNSSTTTAIGATTGQIIIQSISSKKENIFLRSTYLTVLGYLSLELGKCWEPFLIEEVIPVLLDCIGEGGGSGSGREEFKVLARKIIFDSLQCSSTPLGSRILIRSLLNLLKQSISVGDSDSSNSSTNTRNWRWQVGCLDCLTIIPKIPGNAEHLASDLSSILPILLQLISKSGHFELQRTARECLSSWFSLVRSPEIRALGPLLVDSFIDPPQSSQRCIDSLLETAFAHTIDGPSLSLLRPFLGRALALPGGSIKKGVSNVLANLATSLVDPADIEPYLLSGGLILQSLIQGLGDPNPSVRGHFGKVLGLLVMVVGEESSSLKNLSSHLFSICNSLNSSITTVDRFGAAKALSEIMAARGPLSVGEYLGKNLMITEGIHSPSPRVREAFACLIGFLPDSFAEFFSTKEEAIEALSLLYHHAGIKETMPDCLSLLSDNNEGVRDSSKIACQSFIKRFTTIDPLAIFDLLQENLTSPSWRCRQGCLSLLQEFLNEFSNDSDDSSSDVLLIPSMKELLEVFDIDRIHSLMAKAYLLRFDPTTATIRNLSLAIWKGISTHPLRSLIDIKDNLIMESIHLLRNTDFDYNCGGGGAGAGDIESSGLILMVRGAFEDLIGKIGDRLLLPILEGIEERLCVNGSGSGSVDGSVDGINDSESENSNENSQKDQQSLLYLASIASVSLGEADRFPAISNSLVSLSCRRSPSTSPTQITSTNYIELSIQSLVKLLKHSLLLPFAIKESKEIFRGIKGIISSSAISSITSTSKILPSILDAYLEEIYLTMDPLSVEAILALIINDENSSNSSDLDWVIQNTIPKNSTEFLTLILERAMGRISKWVVPILEGTTPTPSLVEAAILALEDDYDSVYQVSLSQFMESEWCRDVISSDSSKGGVVTISAKKISGKINCLRIIGTYFSKVDDNVSLERFLDAWPQRIISHLDDPLVGEVAVWCFTCIIERSFMLEEFLSLITAKTFKGLSSVEAINSLVKGVLVPFIVSGKAKKEEISSLILRDLSLSPQNLIVITGSLIRVSKESPPMFEALVLLSFKFSLNLKAFYPQLQRLFSSSLKNPLLRSSSFEAMKSLLPHLSRYDHLLTEWFDVLSSDGGGASGDDEEYFIVLLQLLMKSNISTSLVERIPEVSKILLSSPSPSVRREVFIFIKNSLEKYDFEDPHLLSSLLSL